jgi:hypothetical protein
VTGNPPSNRSVRPYRIPSEDRRQLLNRLRNVALIVVAVVAVVLAVLAIHYG